MTVALLPDVANYTSSVVFGATAAKGASTTVNKQLMIEGVAMEQPHASKANHDYTAAEQRGACSHVRAQAEGLARFLTQERALHAWSVHAFDDASMWVAFQGIERQRFLHPSFAKFQQRFE